MAPVERQEKFEGRAPILGFIHRAQIGSTVGDESEPLIGSRRGFQAVPARLQEGPELLGGRRIASQMDDPGRG